MSSQLNRRYPLVIAIIFAMALVGCTVLGCSGGSGNADANLKAQAEPSNGAVLTGSSNGNAGVKVTTAPGESAYVKVKNLSGGTTVGFYVRSGSTAEVSVPAGTYSVQFATGETWYGAANCFGSKTSYGQDKSVALVNGDVVAYTLQRSSGGNFSMNPLNGSVF